MIKKQNRINKSVKIGKKGILATAALVLTASLIILFRYASLMVGNQSTAGRTMQISDYALLVGTFGLFAALAIVMYLTRNVNWYRISDRVVNSSTEKKTQQADDPNKENRD